LKKTWLVDRSMACQLQATPPSWLHDTAWPRQV
jgi:hypothetical protein